MNYKNDLNIIILCIYVDNLVFQYMVGTVNIAYLFHTAVAVAVMLMHIISAVMSWPQQLHGLIGYTMVCYHSIQYSLVSICPFVHCKHFIEASEWIKLVSATDATLSIYYLFRMEFRYLEN